MTPPKTNDELRQDFARIYGRLPSVPELLQFKKNRPVRYFEPRKVKKRKITTNPPDPSKVSRIALPAPQLLQEIPQNVAQSGELVLNLLDDHDETTHENAAHVQDAVKDRKEEEETEPRHDQGVIANC